MQKSHRYILQKLSCSPFRLKFCCHGNGGRLGENLVCSVQRRNPEKTIDANISQIFLQQPSYSLFCPVFRCRGNEGQLGVNINGTVKLADPDNPTLEPNRKWIGWLVAEIWPFEFLPERLFQERRSPVGRSVGRSLLNIAPISYARNVACA